MDDSHAMEVSYGTRKLSRVKLGCVLMEFALLLDQTAELAIGDVLHDEEEAALVLKGAKELRHVGVSAFH
jgi:hypothetical protein